MIVVVPALGVLRRLTSPLEPDAYLDLLPPRWSTTPRATIESVTPVGGGAVAIGLAAHRRWHGHRPGQYVVVGVDVDGRRHQRCYSITSLPDGRDRRLEITVRPVPGGVVSDFLATRIRLGTTVQLDGPYGDFVLPDPLPDRLVFVAGGSGITPIMGMLRWLATRPAPPLVTVVHHAPAAEAMVYGAALARLRADHSWCTAHLVHTADGGRPLDADALDHYCPDWRDRAAFVCGPDRLLQAAVTTWHDADRGEHLHLEDFGVAFVGGNPGTPPTQPSTPLAADDHGHAATAITFARSACEAIAAPGASLLDTAESAGLTPRHGCRRGICHACTTPLLAGRTRDLRDGRVAEPGDHVQLCVSTALDHPVLDC